MTAAAFYSSILTWFDHHGRKTLPWQQNKTPYRVWVSEIMLQQTQVTTVIPYFSRFMERFPDVGSLAFAKEDEVLHLWTGLGYYNRARNLHRTAKSVMENFGGEFPASLDELQNLPGIGRSTAGAILSIAFEKRAAILDGNVKRVLTRFHGIREWPGEKNTLEKLWEFAERHTPQKRVADYTQAMMDLGATICVRGKPKCSDCPLQKNCRALQLNIEKEIPRSKPKKTIPTRETILLIVRKNKEWVFLEKRPPTGIWSSLWSLPELPISTNEKEIKFFCSKQFGCEVEKFSFGEKFRHTFSHFHLDILPVEVFVTKVKNKIMEEGKQIWFDVTQPSSVGLPAPVKKLLIAS
jgi:A/G-specific adenine glycosylase